MRIDPKSWRRVVFIVAIGGTAVIAMMAAYYYQINIVDTNPFDSIASSRTDWFNGAGRREGGPWLALAQEAALLTFASIAWVIGPKRVP